MNGLAIEALGKFSNVKRRMEIRGAINGVTVYDDFAHHPTAIATTLEGLKKHCGDKRIIAILEPRSNTMKMGVHKTSLAKSLKLADSIFVYQGEDIIWDIPDMIEGQIPLNIRTDISQLVNEVVSLSQPGDNILVMSNGGFAGIHDKLLQGLEYKYSQA
jgi:UDP-N-acetylmuramate: L-alanyl-gamma-D-glutamyl-meso-diaminopimelate ligase